MEEKKTFTYGSKVKEARTQLGETLDLCQKIANNITDKLSDNFPELVVDDVEIVINPKRSWIDVKIILEEGSDKEASLTVDIDHLLYKVSTNLPKSELHRLGLFVETVLRVFTDEREEK